MSQHDEIQDQVLEEKQSKPKRTLRPTWPLGFVRDPMKKRQSEKDVEDVKRYKKTEGELQQRLDETEASVIEARLSNDDAALRTAEMLRTLWQKNLGDVRKERMETEKYILQNEPELSRWEQDLDPELRLKFRDPEYLPTREEVLQIKRYMNYSDEFGDHEILSKEFIAELGAQIQKDLHGILQTQETACVLEVGAGSGRLTHFLSNVVMDGLGEEEKKQVTFVATDSSQEQIPSTFHVQSFSTKDAVKELKPTIVITSWPRVSPEEIVQDAPWIKEVVVMGEPEVCAGGNGNYEWEDVKEFAKKKLQNVTDLQVCRTDYHDTRGTIIRHSKTTVFVRK